MLTLQQLQSVSLSDAIDLFRVQPEIVFLARFQRKLLMALEGIYSICFLMQSQMQSIPLLFNEIFVGVVNWLQASWIFTQIFGKMLGIFGLVITTPPGLSGFIEILVIIVRI